MGHVLGLLALAATAAFAGAALYINIAEHPARMQLDLRGQLAQWKPSYEAGIRMQGSLAIVGALLGLAAWATGGDWRWAIGAVAMAANWPFTLFAIMPTNRILKATRDADAGDATRTLLARWARLHAVRSGLGIFATAALVWAAT